MYNTYLSLNLTRFSARTLKSHLYLSNQFVLAIGYFRNGFQNKLFYILWFVYYCYIYIKLSIIYNVTKYPIYCMLFRF